eukprot:CAMPEP_0170524340 /NCGR_PEP_ID=MMETSP0209-20121228/9778_1 /TAXON_ID=665100 ORGANISM="Litonotus pictus, Strain P1" /NCGR_SAMPLE_ID=MMETSP0209 /ASSEMBLY_ACC=CAM_ASM_000301 /LENGTH=207 /DNA_ID=CAMNT_0010812965 /DNA_START=176 /DNA_END=796 /DNA_ORIENTATION=+
MSFILLFNSITVTEFVSVKRIVYESSITKFRSNVHRDLISEASYEDQTIQSNSLTNEHHEDEKADNLLEDDSADQVKKNLIEAKQSNIEEENRKSKSEISSAEEKNVVSEGSQKGGVELKTDGQISGREHFISERDREDPENFPLSKETTENGLETDKIITKGEKEQSRKSFIHVSGPFHHEMKEMAQPVFELKMDDESNEEAIYEW